MASTISSCKCPHCGFEQAYNEYYYRSDEEVIFCDMCGYYKERFMARKDGKPVLIQTSGESKAPQYAYNVEELDNPYCALIIGHGTVEQHKFCEVVSVGNEEQLQNILTILDQDKDKPIYSVMMHRYDGKEHTQKELLHHNIN